jgi:hypothetical protein
VNNEGEKTKTKFKGQKHAEIFFEIWEIRLAIASFVANRLQHHIASIVKVSAIQFSVEKFLIASKRTLNLSLSKNSL